MAGTVLKLSDISHWFGSVKVLYNVNLEIERGQIVALVGPSGCGKTTLLKAIVGTHSTEKGQICMCDDAGNLNQVRGPGRDRGIVYQRYSLFPHLTALENVAYGLMVDQTTFYDRWFSRSGWKKLRKEHLKQAEEMLHKLRLSNALNKYPPELSGGMCQRVAIAQALIMKPKILLLDEPFGALDEATREELQKTLLQLYTENSEAKKQDKAPPHTVLIVTHEINEAIYVSDRVVGLSQYWNWEKAGEKTHPGATIVYDKPAPVFEPDDARDFLSFSAQKDEILRSVFEESYCQDHDKYIKTAKELTSEKKVEKTSV